MHIVRAHLDGAEQFLASPSANAVRYAALHLRMCMELMTYEKLRSYANRVPVEVQRRWQPPQAVRALLEFEPEADQNYTIEVSGDEVPDLSDTANVTWLLLGEHKTLAAQWLGRHYHKVGRLLHAATGADDSSTDVTKQTEYLREVGLSLSEVLTGTISGSAFPITTFTCTECGNVVARNSEALQLGKVATCLNVQCGTEYAVKWSPDGAINVTPLLSYPPCNSCNSPMHVRPKQVAIGSKLSCPKCGQVHRVLGHHWVYGPSET